jgi:uncharacterized membrane protein
MLPRFGSSTRLAVVAFSFALFAAAMAQPAYPQSSRGSIEGRVVDPTGADVPRAVVKVTPGRHSVKTNKKGQFSVSHLVPGTYSLTIASPGFPIYRAKLKVAEGSVTRLKATLRNAPPSGPITVHPH